MCKWFKLLLLVCFLGLSKQSYAAEKLFLTGAEVTSASTMYLYMGTSIPLPGSNLGKGFVLHLWADYQTYSYQTGITDIEVDFNGLSATLGYHNSGEDNWWNARLGVVRSDSSLSPNDPGNDSAGTDVSLKVQLEGEKRLSADFKMIGNYEYIFDRSAHWTRVRLLSRNDGNTYDGPELIYQGDDSYSAYQLGWILTEMPVNNDWSMGLKAGLRFDESDTAVYVGVELSIPY